MSNNLNQQIRKRIESALIMNQSVPDLDVLKQTLRFLSKWRASLIQGHVLKNNGTKVKSGPLAGLDFIEQSAEGCHVAKLLGTYEQPLQPHIQEAIDTPYDIVINIGCAEGYYAVGMARKMDHTRALAFDINEAAQKSCSALAKKNGVADRVEIGSRFNTADFQTYANAKVLVLCDIEGAELDLLKPDVAPALAGMDLIVESHECLLPGLTERLVSSFSASHDIIKVFDTGLRTLDSSPSWFCKMDNLDQILAIWEWRTGPTPWLVMKSKNPSKTD